MSQDYLSVLDSLVFDTSAETTPASIDDLSLWTNAQFTFDMAPRGVASSPEDKPVSELQSDVNFDEAGKIKDNTAMLQALDTLLALNLASQQDTSYAQPHLATVRHPLILPKIEPADSSWASFVQMSPNLSDPSSAVTVTHKQTNKRSFSSTDEDYAEKLSSEEDKRRRNTAASARFRAKKKLREQAMEKTIQEMESKSKALEDRVQELEQEIRWLRNLLVEKKSSTNESS